jgi:heme/copper-type cytochrome/quinol oxidase subunit 2
MQNALGLMGDQALMVGITLALGIGGVAALFFALFWPTRWRMKYRMEVGFVVLLVALAIFADNRSAATFEAYQAGLRSDGVSGSEVDPAAREAFDREITVLAFQWGFAFTTEAGEVSRNAVRVEPDETVLFRILSNDVIHGFNIPVAGATAEFDPGKMREMWIRTPSEPGKYLIQCLNYCGVGHAQMKAWLVVGDADADAA